MRKILVVTGSRAEYGLLKPVMQKIQAHRKLSLDVVVTGMHTLRTRGSTAREVTRDFKATIIPIKERMTMLQAFAEMVKGLEEHCARRRPDCILLLGDRDEPLAAGIVATHLDIPLAHIHGGDISGRTVDESNRRVLTTLARIHFPATKRSAARIKKLNPTATHIITAGTPGLDGIRSAHHSRVELSRTLKLDPKKEWLVFVQHPTPFDQTPLKTQIEHSLSAIAQFPHEKILIYPNNDTGGDIFLKKIRASTGSEYHLFPSLPRDIYIDLLRECEVLVGNSSSGIIEANFLGTPAVDIGNRQEGRERGKGVISTPYDDKRIVAGIHRAIRMKKARRGASIPSPYGSGNASKLIAQALATEPIDTASAAA